jgi:hypothetical protein
MLPLLDLVHQGVDRRPISPPNITAPALIPSRPARQKWQACHAEAHGQAR